MRDKACFPTMPCPVKLCVERRWRNEKTDCGSACHSCLSLFLGKRRYRR
ncbi:hypothetical protein BACCAP_04081 [Pseudoflavonifractor capillosus ATCC 29799]|uniref:Uncharacterized protein n=1 Tax=Pseudoflavonifractor capillosus ATCC 29799 TaxID=411467 RepID=A6P0S0_9FIRM|nr:hypothetical protein BACCAP_04081 [Pseudoflavonifractor capillosus ATCC 29799]